MMKVFYEDYIAIQKKLEAYAAEYKELQWQEWPMIREAAKKFKISQKMVIDMVDDSECLDLVAGFRTYSGIGTLNRAEQRIEYYENS